MRRFLPFLMLLSGCVPADHGTLTGHVEVSGFPDVVLVRTGVHYKLAPGDTFRLQVDAGGRFRHSAPLSGNTRHELIVRGQSYPVVLSPGKTLTFESDGPRFSGWLADVHNRWIAFDAHNRRLLAEVRERREEFRAGTVHPTLDLYRLRIQLATDAFGDTPMRYWVHRMTGEYLAKRLEAVRYTDLPGEHGRILEEAATRGFLTLESLQAQRAGIRDFTDAWIKSFPGYDPIGSESDWKRRHHRHLDSLRAVVTAIIPQRNARAHAEFFLQAERFTDAPFAFASERHEAFRADFADFTTYVGLLDDLSADLSRLQPGEPAPFLPPLDLSAYLGRYVLLDFWATWCVPCLVEFPHMERIYDETDRSDVEFISISIDEDFAAYQTFLAAHPHAWPQLHAEGAFLNPLFRTYRAPGIPFYVLIDRNGAILRYNDIRPSVNLESVLDSLLQPAATKRPLL